MYVDLSIKPYDTSALGRILSTARRLGYEAVAVEGLDKEVEGGLRCVPRITYKYVGRPISTYEFSKGYLIAYELGEPTDIKSLSSLRGRCHVLRISNKVLAGLRKKYVNSLRNCGIPIEVSVKDLILDNGLNYNVLRGFNKLLPLVERGDVELVISSSAGDEFELIHPLELVAILKELGLSELISIKAISSLPLRVLRMVSNAV